MIILALIIGILIGVTAVVLIALCDASGRMSDREEDEFRRWVDSLERKDE